MTSAQPPPLNLKDGRGPRTSPASSSHVNCPNGSGDNAGPEAGPPSAQAIPIHPIPSLQAAFTESLEEVTNGTAAYKPRLAELDARGRREALLGQAKDVAPFDAPWRYRPGQHQHELCKLIAQISFGVYLLLNGMANSNAQVINILQGHIDEVDEFLEVALEDLCQATNDLNARIDHLKLPLSNLQAFEELLEDRNFRSEILEANEKIDHVLSRTNAAMKQSDDDIDAGLRCTTAFISWLNDQGDAPWRTQRPDVADVFDAMKGNADGWLIAYDDISDRAQDVNNLLIRLTTVIAEMEKRAGEVSRRTWASIPPFSAPEHFSHGGNSVSIRSVGSSRQSDTRPPHLQQPSIRSVSSSRTRSTTTDDGEFEPPPLPEVLPLRLLDPSSHRAPSGSVDSHQSAKQASLPPVSIPELNAAPGHEVGRHTSSSDESLYVLQPRIYTPRTPEPLPSPMLQDAANITPKQPERRTPTHPASGVNGAVDESPNKTGSIRQRVSRKTSLPDAIHIPPPPRSMPTPSTQRPSSKYSTTPRTTTSSQPFDSAYCSDAEARSQRQSSNTGSDVSMSPTAGARPQFVHSPRSDNQQYYRPVRASPHSPLQQRPHTATDPHFSSLHHLRSQPPHLGSTSTLSNVTVATYDERSVTPTARSHGGDRSLKKKKSAFGWFKKAFSLDEEERAAFEARKAMGQTERYYDSNSPKFIDGRRVR